MPEQTSVDPEEQRRLDEFEMRARIAASRVEAESGRDAHATMLRAVIANNLSLTYIKDLRGRYLLANEAFERSFSVREAERIFIRSGYRVITAASGAEAVRLAAEHDDEIHLLLTDVVMPNMLGKEVAEKIRRIKPDIEVLFMSGYAQPVLALHGRIDRDVNLIEKPFSASAIIEKAGRILNGHFDGFRTIKPSETLERPTRESPPDPEQPPAEPLGTRHRVRHPRGIPGASPGRTTNACSGAFGALRCGAGRRERPHRGRAGVTHE
jgi:CheY-like chemotaxis protein